MSQAIRIFKLDDTTQTLVIDREEIRLISEFKEILTRDKGDKGDSNSVSYREKKQATKEFTYIYFYCDYQSPYINYPELERHEKSKADAQLPDRWERDNLIDKAITKYEQVQETPSMKMLKSLNRGLLLSSKVVDTVTNNIQGALNLIIPDKTDTVSTANNIIHTEALVTNLGILIKLSTEVPKALRSVNETIEQVKKEVQEKEGIRGGGDKGGREDA